jgi:UDP-N-acetylglucosamine transferase subunit ALG13
MQLGFDRLIEAMDTLAPELGQPMIAQIGKGSFVPRHMEARVQIAPDEFERLVEQAQLIVSHAGIGTVLTAARFSKPVVLLARRAHLYEHRNDHQQATVDGLRGRPGILIADSEANLTARIGEGLALGRVSHRASDEAQALNQAVAKFIATGAL